MKRILSVVLVTLMLLTGIVSVSATPVGTVIGNALNTDIVVYINNYAIPSFAVNGQSVVVAEDLRNFCFNVVWDGNARSLNISRNYGVSVPTKMEFVKDQPTGSLFTRILSTDIGVYANGQKVTSYAMNGYTMVPVEELTMLGSVVWNGEHRALYMTVDGVEPLYAPQEISKAGTEVPYGAHWNYPNYHKLKNMIMSAGSFSNGSYNLTYRNGNTMFYVYYFAELNAIALSTSIKTEGGAKSDMVVYLYDARNPYFNYTITFPDGTKYKMRGEFKDPANYYTETLNEFPEELKSTVYGMVNSALYNTDVVFSSTLGMSFSDFNIRYA